MGITRIDQLGAVSSAKHILHLQGVVQRVIGLVLQLARAMKICADPALCICLICMEPSFPLL